MSTAAWRISSRPYVANFVKTGDPNGGSLPKWPTLTVENKSLMELGDRVVVIRAVPVGADAVIAGPASRPRRQAAGARAAVAASDSILPRPDHEA